MITHAKARAENPKIRPTKKVLHFILFRFVSLWYLCRKWITLTNQRQKLDAGRILTFFVKWFTHRFAAWKHRKMCGNLDNNFSGWINKYIACNLNSDRVSICWLTGLVTFNSNLITVGFLNYQLERISSIGFLLSLFMNIYCWFEHDNSANYWNRFAHFCHLPVNFGVNVLLNIFFQNGYKSLIRDFVVYY